MSSIRVRRSRCRSRIRRCGCQRLRAGSGIALPCSASTPMKCCANWAMRTRTSLVCARPKLYSISTVEEESAMDAKFVLLAIVSIAPVLAASCESLASLSLPATTITKAETVPEGANSLPAHCRVAATLKPSSDSDIRIEVWMPAAGWNGKYQAVGNGGWSGAISTSAMEEALKSGYATSSTDTGHEGGSASFALGHPEKLIDYAYRSEHEMTLKAKAIVQAFYGKAQTHAYWSGCSAGGKQGLKEAQMYPDDFDGIVAGSPGAYWVGRATQAIWVAQAVHRTPESEIPAEKYRFIHEAVLKACDRLDGVEDGVIENPATCHFDPQTIACESGDAQSCLTPPQVEA